MKEDEKQLKPVGVLTGGGDHEVKVVVREATKKGYAEAYEATA